MTRSSKPDPKHDVLSDSPVFGDLEEELRDDGFPGDGYDDSDDAEDSLDEDWESAIDQDTDDEDLDEDSLPPTRRPRRSTSRRSHSTGRHQESKKPLSGIALIIAGVVFGGIGIATPGIVAGIAGPLEQIGLTPAILVVAGVVLIAIHRLGTISAERNRQMVSEFESIAAQLEALGAPQEGGDLIAEQLDRVLLSAERQLEKIQNLTRATKMYGKPLVDISKQVADLSVQLSEVIKMPTQVESAMKTLLQSLQQGDDRSEHDAELADQMRELGRIARGTQSGVRELHEQLGDTLAQRIESLSAQIAATAVEIQSRQGESDDTEELTAVRREMQAITTGLSQLSVKVSQLPAIVASSRPAVSPQSSTQSAGEPSDQGTDAAPSASPSADGVLAQKIAGTRPAQKGVLSAIEKLKSMRG